MLLNLLRLDGVNWKRVASLGGAAGIVIVLAFVRIQSIELGKERTATERFLAAYQHPKVARKTRVVTLVGPVRTVTRVVEAEGRKETTVTEEREGVLSWDESNETWEPVAPESLVVLSPRRERRRLIGVSGPLFHRTDRSAWTAWGGYSLGGRLDLCGGITGAGRAAAQAMWRF